MEKDEDCGKQMNTAMILAIAVTWQRLNAILLYVICCTLCHDDDDE
jgi:hypothetical protein